jgi:hypothetical protein
LDTQWPQTYKSFITYFSIVNFDYILSSVTSADCIGDVTYYKKSGKERHAETGGGRTPLMPRNTSCFVVAQMWESTCCQLDAPVPTGCACCLCALVFCALLVRVCVSGSS